MIITIHQISISSHRSQLANNDNFSQFNLISCVCLDLAKSMKSRKTWASCSAKTILATGVRSSFWARSNFQGRLTLSDLSTRLFLIPKISWATLQHPRGCQEDIPITFLCFGAWDIGFVSHEQALTRQLQETFCKLSEEKLGFFHHTQFYRSLIIIWYTRSQQSGHFC